MSGSEGLTLLSILGNIPSMIRSFRCRDTEALWDSGTGRGFLQSIERVALRKLQMLDQARRLEDLRTPPANRLEALTGDRAGQWSIRVNAQYRVCFVWDDDAYDVEIVDYH
jgi:proteic killer suppression protein